MNLPRHKLGVHLIPIHQRTADIAYMQALKSGCIKIVDPDPVFAKRLQGLLDLNGILWLRDWALSEQKDDLTRDPVGTGIRHAEDWANKLATTFSSLDQKRVIVSGINEPFVRNDAEITATVQYTEAMLKRCTQLGIRMAALNLSVGWPMNHDDATHKSTKPDWGPFLSLEDDILAGNHFLCVHEYFYADEAESIFVAANGEKWGWLAHRVDCCPMDVPIIIGEFGMEKAVDDVRWHNEGMPPRGWIGNISPQAYADQIWHYIDTVNPNVFAVMPFTTDSNRDWYAMDTAGAHADLLARVHAAKWIDPYPTLGTVTPPVVTPPVVTPPVQPGSSPTLVWPKMPRITTWFNTSGHTGLDVAVNIGTPLYAMYDGIVAWSDLDDPTVYNGGYGNYIRIYYPALGFDSFYGHMSRRDVKTGDPVTRGQLVGLSGSTGNSTGPHVHLEIRIKQTNSVNDRAGVGPFSRGQVDPMAVRWALEKVLGVEER